MTAKKKPGVKASGAPRRRMIRYTFDDGTIDLVPLEEVAIMLAVGSQRLLRAKREEAEITQAEKSAQAKAAASEPRKKKVDAAKIKAEYRRLRADGKSPREARGLLYGRKLFGSPSSIYRATKDEN